MQQLIIEKPITATTLIKGNNMKPILMSRNNHNGWKLSELLTTVVGEIGEKTNRIKNSTHHLRDEIIQSNDSIIILLNEAVRLHDEIYRKMDSLEENKGPKHPRL